MSDAPPELPASPHHKLVRRWVTEPGFWAPIVAYLAPALGLVAIDPELGAITWRFYWATFLAVDFAVLLGIVAGVDWWWLAMWVVWGQAATCAFLLANLGFLRRFGRFGRFLERREKRARQAYERHHWLRQGHVTGLAAFTILPAGSGIYLGVVLAKATGLRDVPAWAALMTGTALWTFALAYTGGHAWAAILGLF